MQKLQTLLLIKEQKIQFECYYAKAGEQIQSFSCKKQILLLF